MALPSQSGRSSGGSRSFVTGRRRRGRNRRWFILLALLLIGGGLWYWLSGDSSESDETTQDAASVDTSESTSAGSAESSESSSLSDLIDEQPIDEIVSLPYTPSSSTDKPAGPATPAAPPVVEAVDPPADQPELPVDPIEKMLAENAKKAAEQTDDSGDEAAGDVADTSTASDDPTGLEEEIPLEDRKAASGAAADKPDFLPSDVGLSRDPATIEQLDLGMSLLREGKEVEGRRVLSSLIFHRSRPLKADDEDWVRRTLIDLSNKMIFSRDTSPNDPLTQTYKFAEGDFLLTIGKRFKTPYQFLERINKVKATQMWVGRKLKVINGPFHAVVDKSDYRMDLYLTEPGTNHHILVASYVVGLGENDSTPIGKWLVKRGGKVSNPMWRNPRTAEVYQPDDPKNPIGEYWIGLKGIDDNTSDEQGYGIHGTIDPQSIGRQASMGCIRMMEKDLVLVYDMLMEGATHVFVVE